MVSTAHFDWFHFVSVQYLHRYDSKSIKIACGNGTCYRNLYTFIRTAQYMRSLYWTVIICFLFWHSYLTPHPRKPAILRWQGNITGRHLAGTVLMDSPVAELIYFSIRLVKNLWCIQLCQFPYKDIWRCPPSNDPKFHLFVPMPFTDVRKVLLITTWISSCFFLSQMCIIIPRLWSWRKASRGFISSIRDRSERKQTLHGRKPSYSCLFLSPESSISAHTATVSSRPGAYLVTLLLAGTYL